MTLFECRGCPDTVCITMVAPPDDEDCELPPEIARCEGNVPVWRKLGVGE